MDSIPSRETNMTAMIEKRPNKREVLELVPKPLDSLPVIMKNNFAPVYRESSKDTRKRIILRAAEPDV